MDRYRITARGESMGHEAAEELRQAIVSERDDQRRALPVIPGY